MSKILRILLIWLCGLSLTVFAGTTGKIVGTVTDEESNEPLPMVNVLIEGSNLGAATDIKGHFSILNVPPGTYNLVGSMMGYGKKRIQNVRVTIDQTTQQNFTLKTVSLVGEEVTVVAERPVVQKDISNSQMNLGAQEIEILPLTTIKEVLTLQAGIERGSEGILVRGGGANQTQVSIDGMITNDERSNIGYLALSQSAVQEIQIQTGGFNAEYGNLRSGLVNVVTKEGNRATYNLSANLNYRPPANKYFGESIYSANSYFNRPYLDPAVCWTGTANGVWDDHTRHQYPHFEGWDAVSEATVRDKDPKNDLTPAGAKRLYEWQHRRQGDIDKPDYVVDLGFGGPFPLISKMLGEARFFLTYFRNQNMFIFPLARDNYGENFTQLKLTSNISPSMSLTLTGLYGEVHSVSPYDWITTPTGRVLELQGEIADLVNSTNGSSILYMPGYYSPSAVYRNFVALKFVHQLNPNTFYEISLQHKMSFYNTYQTSLRDTSRQYEVVPGYFVDEAPYGYWGYGSTGIEGMSMGGWMNLGRDQSENSTTSFRFDLINQINRANQLKGGAEVVYNDFNIRSGTECPSMTTWTRDMYYRVFPYRLGAYLQDKLEVRGFIANLGVRFDYSDPNTNDYVLQEYDKYFRAGFGKTLEQSVTTEAAEPSWNLCPRLGISHPITDNSKLYFNYGHFLTEPQSTYRFRLQRESNGLVTYLGNRSLEMEKTVAYELGFSQNVLDMLLLNVAAYYKDVTNQPGWIYYQNINSAVQYYKSTNNNYADIRGFEITLKKQMGRWLSGFVNYTYDVVTSGYFGYTKYFE
ncbi:TonB-dependent receptor, partial [candidate division KSB1 bacterium]|nr:TonB-dependent receptor [candidate division KSB1 bacterium]